MGGPVDLVWTRRYAFQAVHKLDVPHAPERTHGHEFFLEVSFTGDVDQADTLIAPVLKRLHGQDLGFIRPPSGENIVDWIHNQLSVLGPRLKAVALQETKKNRFISGASELRYV